MKKKLSVSLAAAMAAVMGTAAFAVNGDIVGEIYNTDILTTLDGVPIESYSIDGETVIPLEALSEYGYEVYYDDRVRKVFVTHSGDIPDDLSPQITRGKLGGTSGYIYESDIKAYLNGVEIPAYALNGQMGVVVEDIGRVERGRNVSPYGFTYGFYDASKLLTLKSEYDRFPDKKSREAVKKTEKDSAWKMKKLYELDSCDIMTGSGGTAPYNNTTIEYFGNDGVYIDLANYLEQLGFSVNRYGNLTVTINNVRDDRIEFTGTRRITAYNTSESGTYTMELPRLAVEKIR
ncbi:MAG: hypothetical protein Q4G33_14425 [bacterium]|nr:hypothetical protein [bacterium]